MINNNESILKTQQRFKSEKHHVFTEETNNIALISNDHKIMFWIDSIQTYAYGTSKGLLSEKEEIKCKNMMKRYKKLLTSFFQKKTKTNIIQIGHKSLIIYAEY